MTLGGTPSALRDALVLLVILNDRNIQPHLFL
jgi:hypothetical protein